MENCARNKVKSRV